jgi:RNA polymerase sigma-54 factor
MAGLGLGTMLVQRAELQQKLVLTPQQRQLVSLLELSDDQVAGYLDEIVRDNPALERAIEGMSALRSVNKGSVRRSDDDLPPIEARLSASSDLEEHLYNQLRLERTSDEERRAAHQIIFNLDHRGLLAIDLEEIARLAEVELSDAEDAQWVVMRLEPEGCGASSLEDYLVFMVQERYPEDEDFPKIIRKHLHSLMRKKYEAIGKDLGLDPEDVEEYHNMLADIEPWPARRYSDAEPDFIQPCMEVFFDKESNRWRVRMAEPSRTKLRIDPKYEAKVEAMPDGPEKKEAQEQLEQARWVVQNMEERHSLVKQIAELAVAHQRGFFERGDTAMQNFTMASISETLRRDTSTISRAVMGRYFTHPHGVMALRDLFVNRGASTDVSEAKLHQVLRDLIDKEDKHNPLSDDALAVLLKKKGINASRRTVAKHRDRIGIPSSRDRGAR